MVEHRAEIAHIEPTAARFAFVKMLDSVNGGPPIRSRSRVGSSASFEQF
jgi:hypothetical protein